MGPKRVVFASSKLRYVRYADDFVVLTCSEDKVVQAYEQIFERLEKSVALGGLGLRMHPLDLDYPGNPNCKTRYVDLSSSPLTFVGFEIAGTGRGAQLRIKPENVEKFAKRWKKLVESEAEVHAQHPDQKSD